MYIYFRTQSLGHMLGRLQVSSRLEVYITARTYNLNANIVMQHEGTTETRQRDAGEVAL